MSSPTIFLAATVGTWVALRLATVGLYPGAFAKPIDLPPPTKLAAQAEAEPAAPNTVYVPYPVHLEGPEPAVPRDMLRAGRERSVPVRLLPPATARSAPTFDLAAMPPRPLSVIGVAMPPPRPGPFSPSPSLAPARFDRWQLTGWGMFRDETASTSLATAGMLGGSQAGTRLAYRFDERFAATARLSAPAGRAQVKGGEAALGVRFTPFAGIPVSITAERRQRLGKTGGRNDFALFAEGGLYNQPLPVDLSANAYLQAGVVGVEERDLFIDGSFTLTRPFISNVDGGIGVWGGAQPGLSRLDIGPRLSMPLYEGVKIHFDWRQQVAGNADPGSGPVVSIGADF